MKGSLTINTNNLPNYLYEGIRLDNIRQHWRCASHNADGMGVTGAILTPEFLICYPAWRIAIEEDICKHIA
jgi:hypothetical protein